MIRWMAVLLTCAAGLVVCAPLDNAGGASTDTLRNLLTSDQTAPGPEVVELTLLDEVFEANGPYALRPSEREFYEMRMYQRYEDGFYEPLFQKQMAQAYTELLDFAAKEEGVTFEMLLETTKSDFYANLETMDDDQVERYKFMAGNSIVTMAQIQREPMFELNGFDPKHVEAIIETMREIRTAATDELRRRYPR